MEEYIGVIKPFSGNFAPVNWAFCNGSLLRISEFQALFAIMGTRFGGDGISNFALPDFRSRIALSTGSAPYLTPRHLADKGGAEKVRLTTETLGSHSHIFNGLSGSRETNKPSDNYLGKAAGNFYCEMDQGDKLLPMNELAVSQNQNANNPHNNMAPFLVISFIICYKGLFPVKP